MALREGLEGMGLEVPFYVVIESQDIIDYQTIFDAVGRGEWYGSRLAALATMDQSNEMAELYGSGNKYAVFGGKLERIK